MTVNLTNGGNSNRYWYANNNPYKFIDPDGRETVLVVNENGIGHVGVWTSRGGGGGLPSLYDPNGGFVVPPGGLEVGELADLRKYVAHQLIDGHKVSLFRMSTTEAEEIAITEMALEEGSSLFLDCGIRTSRAIRLSGGRLANFDTAWSPGNVADSAEAFAESNKGRDTGVDVEIRGYRNRDRNRNDPRSASLRERAKKKENRERK